MRNTIRRTIAAAATLVATSAMLTACGGDDEGGSDAGGDGGAPELTEVTLQLQWLPQAQFAGYFAAADQGFFEDEGLDVTINESGGDIVPQDALANGDADFAIAWVPKVLGSIEQGANLTNVAQIFQRSGTLQVANADSGIESVADFEDKKIGSWGFGNEWEIFAAMAAEDLDASSVEIVTQDFNMNAFLQGDIDAAQAMTYNEYAQLLESVDPDTGELYTEDDFNVISYEDTAGRHAPGRDLGRHRAARVRRRVRRDHRRLPACGHQGLGLRPRQRRERGGDHRRGRVELGPEPRAVDGQRDQQADLARRGRHRSDRRGLPGTRRSRVRWPR